MESKLYLLNYLNKFYSYTELDGNFLLRKKNGNTNSLSKQANKDIAI